MDNDSVKHSSEEAIFKQAEDTTVEVAEEITTQETDIFVTATQDEW